MDICTAIIGQDFDHQFDADGDDDDDDHHHHRGYCKFRLLGDKNVRVRCALL